MKFVAAATKNCEWAQRSKLFGGMAVEKKISGNEPLRTVHHQLCEDIDRLYDQASYSDNDSVKRLPPTKTVNMP
jgi:hypothetical protein